MKRERSVIYDLSDIDPAEFFGVADENILHLKNKAPKLNIVARGSQLKVKGSEAEIILFETKLKRLKGYFKKFGHISSHVIDQVFDTIEFTKSQANTKQYSDMGRAPIAGGDMIVAGVNGNIIRAITPNQKKLVEEYSKSDLLMVVGPAGSGKTYTAIALAVKALTEREVKRVILTRPAVEAGEKLGFLPGDMKDKLDPYLQPLYDALRDMIPQKRLAAYMEEGVIQIAPLAYMRGRTLDNAFVILDEAQNTTMSQMKMFLTRMGRSAKFIVTGDATQVDLPKKSDSGLMRTIDTLRGIKGISIIETSGEDIIRHPLVKDIVSAFEGAKKE